METPADITGVKEVNDSLQRNTEGGANDDDGETDDDYDYDDDEDDTWCECTEDDEDSNKEFPLETWKPGWKSRPTAAYIGFTRHPPKPHVPSCIVILHFTNWNAYILVYFSFSTYTYTFIFSFFMFFIFSLNLYI